MFAHVSRQRFQLRIHPPCEVLEIRRLHDRGGRKACSLLAVVQGYQVQNIRRVCQCFPGDEVVDGKTVEVLKPLFSLVFDMQHFRREIPCQLFRGVERTRQLFPCKGFEKVERGLTVKIRLKHVLQSNLVHIDRLSVNELESVIAGVVSPLFVGAHETGELTIVWAYAHDRAGKHLRDSDCQRVISCFQGGLCDIHKLRRINGCCSCLFAGNLCHNRVND